MSIFDVEHQDRAHRVLQRAMASQRMPHAYLFAGPEGVGREMMARRLAQVLLCPAPVQRPLPASISASLPGGVGRDACGQCQSCHLVQSGTHPDLFVIHRLLARQHPDSKVRNRKALELGIDVIRHFVIGRAGTRPQCGQAKVFILRETERMSEEAQNCLLKTLEEPTADTFLILITVSMDRMLPTTRSRCQQVVFDALPIDFVAGRLRALRSDVDAAETDYCARHSGGSLGTALRLLGDRIFTFKQSWGQKLIEFIQPSKGFGPHLLSAPFLSDARELAKALAERDPDISDSDATRAGLKTLLSVLADFYLDALRRGAGATAPLINADQADLIDWLASRLPPPAIVATLRHISEADENLGRYVNNDLILDNLFIKMASTARGKSITRL